MAQEVAENESESVEPEVCSLSPGKFKWETTIVRGLRTQDDKELAVKKLRKKVRGC